MRKINRKSDLITYVQRILKNMRCIGSQTIEVMWLPELMRRDEELQTSKGRETIYKKIEKSKCLVNNSLPDHSEIMRHREILTSRIG